jgi:hypothetical protein
MDRLIGSTAKDLEVVELALFRSLEKHTLTVTWKSGDFGFLHTNGKMGFD